MNSTEMEHVRLGSSDLKVSRVCLGTMTFGEQNTAAEAHAQLDRALDAGINFIDTAEMYAVPTCAETYGASERIVGEWLARQPRERVVLATKIAGPGRNLRWIRGGPTALDAANVREAVEASLKRLRTDYIDLYQIHWPARNQPLFGEWQFDPAAEVACTPIGEQLEALAAMVREGKIRHIGLSNESPWGVMEFVRLAQEHDLPKAVSVQNVYNLLSRGYEYGLSEIGHRERIGLLAYSPLGFGHLSGKYLGGARPTGARLTRFPAYGARYTKPGVEPAVQAYADLARRHGMSPATLALAFAYRRWFCASTVIGATSLAQLDENLAAWDVVLTPEVLAEIDAIHERHTNPAP